MTLLKVDLDIHPPEEWLKDWVKTRKAILKKFGLKPEYIKIFKTKRGLHIYIKINQELSDIQINKLQFLLGDDCTRVKINNWRIERGVPYWNKLFSKVLYRKKSKVVECYYCGNVIPLR